MLRLRPGPRPAPTAAGLLRRSLVLGLLLVPLGLWATAGTAQATVALRLTLDQMAAQSDLVVRGVVVDRTSTWTGDKKAIYTHTTVRIVDRLKGRVPGDRDTVVVRQIGGEADGFRMEISGNARLDKTEQVLLFLKTDAQYGYVQGLAQGKYSIFRAAGGQEMVRRDLTGISFTTTISLTAKQVAFTPGGWEPAVSYTDLLQKLGMSAGQGGTP